jgi:hypothetical protein
MPGKPYEYLLSCFVTAHVCPDAYTQPASRGPKSRHRGLVAISSGRTEGAVPSAARLRFVNAGQLEVQVASFQHMPTCMA